MKLRKLVTLVSLLVIPAMLAGCATIMQGTTQEIGISSTPTGATVKINNQEKGKTPIILDLKRKDNHIVTIEMPGYMPYEATFTKSVSGWVWGNIVFGGLIGLVVDFAAGGIYKLTPTELKAVLQKEGVSSLYRKDALYVAVVLEPNPNWEKVGQLQPIN
ncbi:MAG: PEGA domain-containing protein [Candidatus Omnitrophica bacterium]|nr:PEGA domain-containing protein [Candidatus Omnitrophota bacterium]MBU4479455.1 PEGA domain-containing protein [Candidatus Omnitrophota bacterium]